MRGENILDNSHVLNHQYTPPSSFGGTLGAAPPAAPFFIRSPALDGSDRSLQEHRVAVAEKAVTLPDRVAVCPLYVLFARECRDEEYEGGVRHVKVCYKGVRPFKAVPGIDVEFRFTPAGPDVTVIAGRALQGTQGGRSNAHDPSFFTDTAVYNGSRFPGYEIGLTVHTVKPVVLFPNRLEGAPVNVEGHRREHGAVFLEPLDYFTGEVQTRGRGRNRAVGFRKNRLLPAVVDLGGLSLDVFRKRYFP